MAGLVAGGGWVAVRLIVNPGSVSWLSWLMPEWNRVPLSRYQTLPEIQQAATQAGWAVMETLPLEVQGEQQLLVPILAAPSRCRSSGVTATCRQIVELRVYRVLSMQQRRTRLPYLAMTDRLPLPILSESFVVAPIATSPATSPGTNRPLPLETIAGMQGTDAPGLWFNLQGTWARGSDRIAYGQLVRYDEARRRLYALTQWTSPPQVAPSWQQVTGSPALELVVNQTVGLEPDLRVYQVNATNSATHPVQLQPISLTQPAIDSRTYKNGLLLARHGLWTPALALLQAAQQRQSSRWSAAAQAQLDLVALHAEITKAQADRTWASASQTLLAHLIDGRWATALQQLQKALADGYELEQLLDANADDIWKRVEAALRVNPQQADVQAWGALIVFARQGREAAIVWLQQHNRAIAALASRQSTAGIDRQLQQVLNLFNDTLLVTAHPSRIIGTAAPIRPNLSDWLQPDPDVAIGEQQQVWYRIQVASFHDGARWQQSPFSQLDPPAIGLAQHLWSRLGLTSDRQIQIIVWATDRQPQTLQATIQAVQFRNGELLLLASGELPEGVSFAAAEALPRPLAMTTGTVPWIEPNQLTLGELNQQQPEWMPVLLPVLEQTLPPTSLVSTSGSIEAEAVLQTVGDWSVKLIDLTGNSLPEVILSLPANQAPRPHTLIVSDQGRLIYSELAGDAGQFLTAITDAGDGKPALLVEDDRNYSLRQWSSQTQRFE
jgi:hypothetical protein